MKVIFTNKNKQILVDDEDYTRLCEYKWYTNWYGYAVDTKKDIRIHRLIMNAPDGLVVDHMDGNPLNNQKHNLRLCTYAENSRNRTKLNKNNTSGVHGVSWSKVRNRWHAQIKVDRIKIHLGSFINLEDAIKARINAEIVYFNNFNSTITQSNLAYQRHQSNLA